MSGEGWVVGALLGRHLVGAGAEVRSADVAPLVLFPGTVATRVALDGLGRLADSSQDFVVVRDALAVVDDPVALLDDVHRVLRPAGTALLWSAGPVVPDSLLGYPWRDDPAIWLLLFAVEQLGHRWDLVDAAVPDDAPAGAGLAVVVRRDPFGSLTAGQRGERLSRIWTTWAAARRESRHRRTLPRPRAIRGFTRLVVRRASVWASNDA